MQRSEPRNQAGAGSAIREATITVYIDRRRFLDDLGIPTVKSIVPMLVTPAGEILWRSTGRRSADAEVALLRVIDRLSRG